MPAIQKHTLKSLFQTVKCNPFKKIIDHYLIKDVVTVYTEFFIVKIETVVKITGILFLTCAVSQKTNSVASLGVKK